MKKEIYSVKCPKRFVFGDPMYFEDFKGEKLASLIADYSPPPGFGARIVLEEKPYANFPDDMERTITLYLAPEKIIQTYMDGFMYKGQEQAEKQIGVDTACYMINVDGRYDEIKTGGDGYWGACQEFSHNHNGRKFLDAIIVTVVIPEFEGFDRMKHLAGYFFEDMQPLSVPKTIEQQMKLE